jgi:hypothetical protein
MATSIRLAEYEREGHNEELIALVVVHWGAAVIDENLLRVGEIEVDAGQSQPGSNDTRDT